MNKAKTQAKHGTTCKIALNRKPKLSKLQINALKYEEERKKHDEECKKTMERWRKEREAEEESKRMHALWLEQNAELIKQN